MKYDKTNTVLRKTHSVLRKTEFVKHIHKTECVFADERSLVLNLDRANPSLKKSPTQFRPG